MTNRQLNGDLVAKVGGFIFAFFPSRDRFPIQTYAASVFGGVLRKWETQAQFNSTGGYSSWVRIPAHMYLNIYTGYCIQMFKCVHLFADVCTMKWMGPYYSDRPLVDSLTDLSLASVGIPSDCMQPSWILPHFILIHVEGGREFILILGLVRYDFHWGQKLGKK